jgi:hypothetical protein
MTFNPHERGQAWKDVPPGDSWAAPPPPVAEEE